MNKIRKFELERISINLPKKLVDKVKEYAYMNGLNITSAYIVLLNNALKEFEKNEIQ